MAKQIPQLTLTTNPGTGDLIPLSQGGVAKSSYLNDVQKLFVTNTGVLKDISGNLQVLGTLKVTGDLIVSGAGSNAYLGRGASSFVNIVGNLNQSGNLFVSGNAIITGTLNATGNTTLGLNHANRHVFSGTTTLGGTGIVLSMLNVTGSGNFANGVKILGQLGVGSNAKIDGSATIGTTLAVGGTSDFADTITAENGMAATGPISTTSSLDVDGSATLGTVATDAVTVSATQTNLTELHARTKLNIGSDLTVTGNFIASGSTRLGSTATNDTYVAGFLRASGRAHILGEFSVTGATRLSGVANVQGQTYLNGTGTNVLGDFIVSGKTLLGAGGAGAVNEVHTRSSGFIGSNLTVSGELNVSGIVRMPQGFRGDFRKKAIFNPSIRVCATNAMREMGASGDQAKVARLSFPANKWDANQYTELQSGDLVFITGLTARAVGATSVVNTGFMPRRFCGIFRVLTADPTYITVPVIADDGSTGVYGAGQAGTPNQPMIMASWRQSNMYGISGIYGMATYQITSAAACMPHWRIMFSGSFHDTNYNKYITSRARSGTTAEPDGSNAQSLINSTNGIGQISPMDTTLSASYLTVAFPSYGYGPDFCTNASWYSSAGVEAGVIPRYAEVVCEEMQR